MYQQSPQGFSFLPDVVKNLLIINFLMFFGSGVISGVFGIDLDSILGLHFWEGKGFYPFQFATYMFMHGSWGHLFMNMFAVWMFGSALENLWGSRKFLTYYLVTGFGAGILHYMVVYFEYLPLISLFNDIIEGGKFGVMENIVSEYGTKTSELSNLYYSSFKPALKILKDSPNNIEAFNTCQYFVKEYKAEVLSGNIVVGASGALFGLLAAYGMLFPNTYIYLYFLLPIKAKHFVIIIGVFELLSGIANSSSSNIAHFAHLGGAIFGFIYIKFFMKNQGTNRFF